MEVKLKRFKPTEVKDSKDFKELRKICLKIHEIYEKDPDIQKNWVSYVKLSHAGFPNNERTNAYFKLSEIFDHFKFSYSEIRHFDIACAPGSFILAARDIAEKKQINYSFEAFTLQNGLELFDDFKGSENVFFHDILKPFPKPELYSKFNLVTGDIGIRVDYDSLEEDQLIELDRKQMELALKLVEERGNVVLKMFTYSRKETIEILDEFSRNFEESFIFKPLSSRVLNNESYLIGIGFGTFKLSKSGSNLGAAKVFEKNRQKFRLDVLESVMRIVKLRKKQDEIFAKINSRK